MLVVEPPSDETARRMRSVRQRGTAAELAVRNAVERRGYTFDIDRSPLHGVRRRADLVFQNERVAVFVDGCFWHACPEHATWPKHNAEWWRAKIEANQHRDRDTDQRLVTAGWIPVRVWEHEDPDVAATRIVEIVRSRQRP